MRFKALYQGPQVEDAHPLEDTSGAITHSHQATWGASGLYALDFEDQPWLLAVHQCTGRLRWMSLADFIKGPE